MTNNCLYKYQLALELGISSRTLATWLNVRYYAELVKLGYIKQQKYLNRAQLNYLSSKLDLKL